LHTSPRLLLQSEDDEEEQGKRQRADCLPATRVFLIDVSRNEKHVEAAHPLMLPINVPLRCSYDHASCLRSCEIGASLRNRLTALATKVLDGMRLLLRFGCEQTFQLIQYNLPYEKEEGVK